MAVRKLRKLREVLAPVPMDRAARRRAYRAEHARPAPPFGLSTCVARRCEHKVVARRPVVVPKPGRMTAAQRRQRNQRRVNARRAGAL